MIRKNIYITKEQDEIFKKYGDISVSEHIRRAIDEYIARLRPLVSSSPSTS